MRSCQVFVNDILAGVLEERSAGYIFSYDDTYLSSGDASPVCVAMPLSRKPYESEHLFPFFSNLLSEGSNREFLESLHHLEKGDDFGLLLETCTYDTIGNVTVKAL